MNWFKENLDLAAVLLLAFLLAAGNSRGTYGFDGLAANPDALNNVMSIDQIGELVGDSVNQILSCSAGQGE